jgi:hypothetical protein
MAATQRRKPTRSSVAVAAAVLLAVPLLVGLGPRRSRHRVYDITADA